MIINVLAFLYVYIYIYIHTHGRVWLKFCTCQKWHIICKLVMVMVFSVFGSRGEPENILAWYANIFKNNLCMLLTCGVQILHHFLQLWGPYLYMLHVLGWDAQKQVAIKLYYSNSKKAWLWAVLAAEGKEYRILHLFWLRLGHYVIETWFTFLAYVVIKIPAKLN